MKTIVLFLGFIPLFIKAQWSYDSLANSYSYQIGCSEDLIVKGSVAPVKFKSKNKNASLFELTIDTLFFKRDITALPFASVFLIAYSEFEARQIKSSNFFVLRNCFYCDIHNPWNCRPIGYYTLISGSQITTKDLRIIRRGNEERTCIYCTVALPIKRLGRKQDYKDIDYIEKSILKHRKKASFNKDDL